MKRLSRFVLLTLGYLFAVVRVAVRRVSNSKNKAKHSRRLTRRRVGMVSGSALALLGLVIAGNLLSPPANAVTIRSGSGSDSCTVDVGSAANASVTKNGDYCIVTVTANTTVSFPAYISQIGIIVVGAGGGGGPDGGTGGAGGEVRYSNAQNVTAGGTVTVSLGAGGAGGVWAGAGSTNGGSTTVSGAGVSYTANGGGAGGGWQNTTWSTGGSGGSGGAGSTGGSGAIGPINPNGDTTVALGSTGSNGPAVAIGGLGTTYFGGGGGGGSCYNGRNALTTGVLGAAGGAGGGGRGANYRYNLDDITYNTLGGTFGHNGTANTGGGGGGGMACDAYASGQNGTYQRTPGGNGSNGVAVMSWQENRTSVTQAPDGCLYNVAEACLQAAKIQLTNAAGAALATSGVTVALVSTSVGSLGGTLSATTDSSGTATLNAFWITGAAIGNTPTLTFEAVGYRNVQTTITMKGYAETLNVVSGSTDSNGAFFGTTGIWLATASSSNLSATTLQNELTARNVTLRASAASSSNVLGDLLWNSAATVTETASSTRTLNLKSSRNVSLNGSARVTSSGQQLNVIVQTDTDGTNGGTFHLDGSASAYGIETNGGSVAIGGGTATTTWNALTIPASYAAGYAQYTGTWWGVELGVNTDIANNKLISTGGGKVRINGYAWASPNVSALYGIAWESGRIDAGAGDIDLIGATNGSPSTATNDNWGVALGANRATANDRPVLVTAGTATLNGSLTTPGTSNYWGVAVGYSNVTTGAGGFNITSTSRSIIWEGCAVTGPTNLAGSAAYLTGTNSYTGDVIVASTAGDTWVSGSQVLSTSGSALTLKATGNVLVDPSTTLQTNAGNITLWSDTDAATSRGGGIKTGVGSSILSTGGAISLSGGTDNSTSWAKGTSTSGDAGVYLGGSINSGAGNVVIRGEETATTTGSADRAGVYIDKAASITASGSGTVTIDGKVDATNSNTANYHYAVWLGNADSANLATVTTASGAISIKGDATSNSYQYRRGIIFNKATVTSTSGAITLDGQAGTATNCLDFYIFSDSNTISSTSGAVLLKGKVGSASIFETGTASSGAGVTLQLSKLSVSSGKTFTLGGASEKVIESPDTAANFAAAVDLTGVAVSSNSTSVRVGKTTNGSAVTLGTAWTTAGPISVYGGTVAVNGSITVTAAGNTFLAKAMGDITTGNSVTVQTNGGNIIFWPNSDKVAAVANNSGRFASGTNLTLRSQGGQIRIAGGLDDGGGDATITSAKGAWSSMAGGDGLPDGYGVGNSTSGQSAGVLLSSGYTLSSAGGDIFIAGMDAPTTSDTSRTVQLVDGLIDSGAGRIALWAKAYANATLNEGMVLHTTNNTAGSIITSANRTAQAITLYSDTSPNTNGSSDGINVYGHGTNTTAFGWQALEVIATGAKDTNDLVNFPGGGIAVTGIASGTASNGGHGIVWQWADALAKDGQVTFTGQNNEATGGYSGAGIYIGDSNYSTANHWGAWHAALTYTNLAGTATDFATSSSNITLNANKFVFYEPSSIGAGSGYWFDTSGDVTIQSLGSTFTSDQGSSHWQFNNIKVAGNPRNFTVGKPTDTSYFLWWADLNVTGEIKFYGRYVFIVANTDLITTQTASGSTPRNTGVLIKTTEKIYFQGTNILQTGGADITIWQDRDNDGVGALYAETGLQVKSNGGNIAIAGGLDDGAANFTEITGRTANDGAPDNYSAGFSGWGANGGVDITGGTYQILSGGGDIFIAGRGSAAAGEDDYGVLLRGGLMYSNAGKIAIYGKAPASCNNNWHRGIGLGWNGDGGVADNIISNSTAADAIKLSADMASCNNGVSVASFAIQDYFSAGSYIATPNGGGITVYGQQGNASASGGAWQDSNQESSILELNYTNIVSNSGPINLTGARISGTGNHSVRFNTRGTGQANSVGALSAARSTGFTAYPTINITSSTSDVTVTGDSQVLYSTTFRNTGDLVLQPYAANFDRTQYFSSGWAASFPATYKNVRIGKAGTNGSNQNNADVILDRFAATGDIAVYAGNISANNGFTTSETSGNGILLKATNTITFTGGSSGANITTQVTGTNSTAPISLWANADASGEGFIYLNNYTDFTTQGAPITMGGSAAATDTSPGSYAVSNTASRAGVSLGNTNGTSNANVRINSNGGNIAIRGKGTGASAWGIVGYGGFNINSGAGRIILDGYQTNTGNGIDLEGGTSNLGTITSAAVANATPAIAMTGKCDNSTNTDAGQRGLWLTLGITVSAIGGGDVSLSGDNTAVHAANPGAIYIYGIDVLASTGKVTLDGGTDGVVTSTSGNTSNIGALSAGSATGAVSIIGDRVGSAGTTNIKTTSDVVIESKGSSFTAVSLAGTNINAVASSIRVAKTSDNSSTMAVGGALAANGPISIYGGNVTLSAGLAVSPSTTGGILVKAGGDIITSGSRTFSTQGGDVTFWSDSDASGSGRIGLDASTTINSKGGKITLAGGLDNGASTVVAGRSSVDGLPDGYAVGNGSTSGCGTVAGTVQGVVLANTASLNSEGGDVFIAGKGLTGSTVTCASGIISAQDLQIKSGNGKIAMYGTANAGAAATYSGGVYFYGNLSRKTIISSSNSSADSIVISGTAGPTAVARSSGVFFHGQTAGSNLTNIIANTGSGGIQITGRSVSTETTVMGDNIGDALEMYGVGVLAKSGAIILTGVTGTSNTSNVYGCSMDHSTAASLANSSASFGARAATTIDGVDMSTSSSDVAFNCDSLISGTTTQAHTALTSGKVVIQPADGAQSFDRAVSNYGFDLGSAVTGFTFGQSGTGGTVSGATQNVQDVTVAGTTSIAGPVSIFGATVTANSNIVTTSGAITLKATDNVVVGAGTNATTRRTIQTSGGAVNLWSNADAAGTGAIATGNFVTLSSGGGDINLAGGSTATESSPTGFAVANATYPAAVRLASSSVADNLTINSGGGNLVIQGTSAQNVTNGMGLLQYAGSTINSGTGAIKIDGRSTASSSAFNRHGLELGFDGTASTLITSSKASGDAIVINGQTSGTSTDGKGLNFWSGAAATYVKVSATGAAGDIKLSGSATTASMPGISVNWARILSAGGTVALDSGTNPTTFGASSTSSAVHIGADTVGGATGDIHLNASGFTFAGTANFRTTGSLSFDSGTAQSFASAQTFAAANVTVNQIKDFRIGTAGTGSSQNAASVTLSAPVVATGAIAIYGGDVTVNANLTTSTACELLLKGTGDVTVGAGTSGARRTVSTVGGPITLWSNSDASNLGKVEVGNYSDLSSGAGAITLAGSATATETSPTGYALAGTGNYGVNVGTSAVATDSVKFTTTTGDITVRGKLVSGSGAGMGVSLWSGANLTSTTGAITVDGASYQPTGAIQGHALYLNTSGGYTTTITTGDASGTAIAISGIVTSGASSGTNAYGVIAWAGTGANNISATGGGDISITGLASTNTDEAIALNKSNIYATSGNISLNGGTQRVAFGQNGANTIGGSTAAANHTGNVNICAGNVAFSTATVTSLRTSGALVIEPCSGSFTVAQSWSSADVTMAAGSARFGRTGNTANIAVSVPLALTGNLDVIGGAITYNGTGVTTTNGGNITIAATGAVTGPAAFNANGSVSITGASYAATGALTSAGADGIAVTATAGSVETAANMTANTSIVAPILLKATSNVLFNNSLTSVGGPITLWSDSDDTAAGGILTATASRIVSNGGAVTLAGGADVTTGYAKATTAITSTANAAYSGIRLLGRISADAGNVVIRGQDSAIIGGTGHNSGIEIEKTSLTTTTTGRITIDGKTANGSVGSGNHFGTLIGWGGAAVTGTTNMIKSTTGDISIKGDASTLNTSVAYGMSFFATSVSSTTGAITVEGIGASNSPADLFWVGADVSSTSGGITVKTGTAAGLTIIQDATAKVSTNGAIALQLFKPSFTAFELAGAGSKTLEPPVGATSFGAAVSTANLTIASTSSSLTIGSATNNAAITAGKATSIAGPITISGGDVTVSTGLTATTANGDIEINSNGTFTNSAAISSAAGNQPTNIKAQKSALTGSINSGTAATQITGYSSGRTIDLGLSGDTTGTLALTNAELATITAGTIRVGDATSGTITVSAAIAITSAKSATFALRTGGNVTATNGATITATNLGIAAGGTISLPGSNGVSGNLALVAGGATAGTGLSFASSTAYAAAAVDSITPVYGIGKSISVDSAPAIGATEVRYLNQTWSAPPVVTVKDEYGYVIANNNTNRTLYTTTVTGSGAPTIAGSTPIIAGGTQTFSSLNFTTNAGSTDLTFTTANLASGGTSAVTTGTYDVQGGEPQSITVAYTSPSAPARKTGFGLTATLKDAGGNTVSGPHATDSITVSVSDGDADLTNNASFISGNTPSTVAGVADFSSLRLSGKVATNYTLTFSVTYLDSASISQTKTASQVVTLTPGDAAKLGSTTQVAGFINRTNFTTQPVVAIQDADGNTVTSASDTIAVAVTAASGTSTQGLTGTTSVAAVSGVATFAGLGKTGLIGDKTLTFTSGSLTSATQNFTLSFGAANKLAMTSPTATVNDTVFGTQPIVTIQDQDGNTVGDSTLRVTLTSSDATIGGTLMNSSVAMDAVAGVANFSGKNVKLTGLVGAKNLTATITGGITLTNSVTITYGAATKLAITRQAAGAVNGVNFTTQPQVTVQDISGNTVTNNTDAISVESSGSVLAGTTPVSATAGVATFAGLKLTGAVGTYTLTYRSGSLTLSTQSIVVGFGAATKLVLTTAPQGFVNRTDFSVQPVITVQDASGNTVTDATTSIDVAISSGALTGTTRINAVAGIATFAGLGKNGAIGSKTLTFSKTGGGLTSATFDFTLTFGAVHHLDVAVASSIANDTAWSTQPVVTIQDEDNNTVADQSSTVTLTATGANIGGTTSMNAVNGIADFAGKGVKLTGAVGSKTLTATISSPSAFAKDTAVTLTFGAATKLALTTQPAGFVNRTNFTVQPVVTVQDISGNTVTNSSISIDASIDTGSLTGTTRISAVNGVATFVGLGKNGTVGAKTLTFSDTAGLLTTATKQFTLTHGAAHHLSLAVASTLVNNTEFGTQPVVAIYDQDENLVTSGAQSTQAVTLSATGATSVVLGGTASMAAVNGVADFTGKGIKLTGLVGAKSLTATIADPSTIIKTEAVTVTYGAADHLSIATAAAGASNGAAFSTQPVVEVRDVSENVVSNSTAQVAATVSNGTLLGTSTQAAVAGVTTFTDLGLTSTAGTKVLTFAAANLTSATQNILAVTGAPTQLRIDVAGTLVNNTAFATQPVVTLLDATNTVVSVGAYSSQTVTLSSPDATIAGTLTMQSVAGVADFAGKAIKLTGIAGAHNLRASIASPATVTQTVPVTITFGAAHHLSIASAASGASNRQAFTNQPAIEVQDVSGNRVTDSTATISVTASGANGAVLGGDTSMSALAGVAYFNQNTNPLKLTGLVGSYSLAYASTGLAGASETIALTHGIATQIALTQNAAGAKSGQAFTSQPRLEVRDADGNLVDTGAAANAEIKVSTGASAYDSVAHTGANLTGPANSDVVTATAGVASFAGLRLEGVAAGAYGLTFSTQNTSGYNGLTVTQNIALTAGSETHLTVVQQPTAIVAGAVFSPVVTVEILDAWNNRVLDAANTITVKPTLVDDALASNALDSSKSAVANASGLVTFTGLSFTKAGTQFIQFTSAGLVSATSNSFVITNAQAHHLVWVTSPVGAKNDYAIKGAAGADPELEVRDQYQNPVLTGASTTVAVSEPTSSTDVVSISGGSSQSSAGSARVVFSNLVLRARVGGYTLRFTAANGSLPINGTFVDSSAAVEITFGDPSALRLTRAAAGANSGAPFTVQPRLNIEDTAGNVVADSILSVTVSESETQDLSGTQTKAAVAGSVDFSGSGLKLSGAVATGLTLKYAVNYNSSEISTTQQINLNPGLAVDLTIDQQPTTVKTRVAFNPVPTVVLRDASGNQVTTDSSSTVTAQLKDSNGNPVGSETAAFTSSGGLVTFTGLAFQAPSTANYYVTFKLTSNSQAVTSNAFDILPGVATELRVTQQPSTQTIDQTPGKTGELLSTQPIVNLYDQDGNLVTTANSGSVTIRVKSTDGAGSLGEGATTANISGGVATFSGVKFVGTPGASYTLDFATTTPNPTLTSLATQPISVTHNDATHLVVTRAAANGRSGLLFGVQPIITVKDRYENTVTSGPDSGVDITATGEITAPVSGLSNPSNDTATASNGVATFQALGLTGLVTNTYKLNFNIVGSTSVVGAEQSNLTISYGSANHLTLTTQPVGGNATGQHLATQPVVEVRDGAGNKVANSVLNVTATIISANGLLLADGSAARLTGVAKAAVAGVASFDALSLYGLPGIDYSLKFAVTGLGFATSAPIQVLHAAAHHLTITQQPTGGNATGSNLAGQPIVQLRDSFENLVTANSTDVISARLSTVSSRERLEGVTTSTLVQGAGAFSGLKVVALPDTDYTLDFSTTISGTTLTSVATNTFRVTYSTPTKLAIVQQPSGGTTGLALNVQPVVEVQDIYGNRVYNYVGGVAASVPAGASLTNSTVGDSSLATSVSDGRATFAGLALTGTPATDYQLTFASGALTSVNSADIRVVPGAPVRIVVLNQPIGAQTGAALAGQPVVEVQDSFGNRVTQDSTTVITAELTSGAGGTLTRVVSSNSVAITATTVNGVATFSNLYMRGLTNRNYRMTFSSGQLVVAESSDYTVHHAAVSNLAWATQPAVGMTGSPLTRAAVLELQDLDGNIADTDNSTVVTAAITSGVGGTIVNRTAIAHNGVVTFANLTLTGTPGVSYKLTFTGVIGSTVVSATESDALVPTHAVPAKLTMRGANVTGGLSGQDLTSQPTLFVRDRFDNIATSDNTTVVTASIFNDLTGSVSGRVTATAINGEVNFSGLRVAGTPGTDYTLNFEGSWSSTTLASTTSNTFTVSKVADVSLAYAAQDYSPNAIVPAQFATDSPGAITFTSNASSLVCELDPATGDLIIKGAGECAVRVDVDADPQGFYLANFAEATLVISKAHQTPISITSAATVDYWSSLNPVATGGSGTGSLSYSIVAGSSCRLIGATILPGDAGSLCQLTATRSGGSNYLAETSAVQTIVVRKINQAALSMASAAAMSVDNLTLFTAGGSGTGAVTYSMVSAGTAHCSVSGSILSATAAGTCSVRATKAASTNYNAVTSLAQTIRVTKDEQTVAFTSTAPMYPVVAGSYTPAATASSGLAVTYSIATNSSGVACVFDSTVPAKINFTATGVCEVVANQAGSSRYAAASVRQIIRVGLLNQTITFDVVPDLTFGTPAFKLLPTTNAGANAVIALATTSNSTACSLAGNIVTLNAAGYCEISATQAGYGSYAAATEVVRGFNVIADLAGAPHIFSTSVTTHALSASFTSPSYTGGSPITGYVLIATDANGVSYENAACPVGSSTINCTIVGLPNDIAYTAVARAITSAGRGAVSNATAAQTPMDAPMAVTNLATSTSNNDLVVTWAAPSALDGTFMRYDIFVAPIGSSFPATTPYSVTDANATSTTIANILNQATASPSPSPSPSTTTATARVSFRRASVTSPTPSASPSNTAPIAPASPYGYKVQIVTITSSSTVASDWNTTSGMQTNFAVPLAPSQLTLTVTGSDLMASWSAPTADGGAAITGYDVMVNGSIVCPATTSLFCAVTGMQPGRNYSIEVFAINAVGLSEASVASHSVAALPVSPDSGSSASNGMAVLSTSAKTVSTKGGQLLTLNARNFAGITDALLDGKQLKVVSNSQDHITLEMPEHSAGLVDLTFKSKIGTLVFQDAVRYVAPPKADLVQQFSRYRANVIATNARMAGSVRSAVAGKPRVMICVGLVTLKHSQNDVRLAKLRAQNVCELGARLDGNLAVRATTEVTKLTGPAARAVKVTYKY